MYFNSKLAALLLAVAGSVVATVEAAITGRDELATLAVTLYTDTGYRGAYFATVTLMLGQCLTLPGGFQAKAESVQISTGYTCKFFTRPGCQGNGIPLSGNVATLVGTGLYNVIDSFSCDRT